jgi:FPC/CPF motif-containing protein YcgG
MTTQTSFVERTAEEKSAWVEQQRALGNKKILSKKDWFKKNETRIMLENMDKKMDLILSKLPK